MKITWRKKRQGSKVMSASIEKARNTYRKELEWMRKQPRARTTKSKSRQDNFYQVEAKAKQKLEDQQIGTAGEDEPTGR